MNIIERIKAKSSKRNRRTGKVATAVSGTALLIAESGLVETNPKLKMALWLISGIAGIIAGNRALQVEEKPQPNENN
jgi:hypothetical protein